MAERQRQAHCVSARQAAKGASAVRLRIRFSLTAALGLAWLGLRPRTEIPAQGRSALRSAGIFTTKPHRRSGPVLCSTLSWGGDWPFSWPSCSSTTWAKRDVRGCAAGSAVGMPWLLLRGPFPSPGCRVIYCTDCEKSGTEGRETA